MFARSMPSPIGPLTLVATADALVRIEFAPPEGADETAGDHPAPHAIVDLAESELCRYFEGTLLSFTVPLAPEGTDFQRAVWRALLDVPYGVVRSYAEIARGIGKPDAVRAVGAANGRNPLPILVPCHRIVGSNGALVGYGGGLDKKAWLLRHEDRVTGSAPDLFAAR